jgi:leader peptidase (prepilin peptidase)/N-methyltransferase
VSSSLVLALTGAVAGAILGSFLNVVIHRTPLLIDRGAQRISPFAFLRGLSWPASHCPHCAHAIGWRDNIPVLSYLMLRGRCRHCRAAFGWRYAVVEALSAATVAYCAASYPTIPIALFAAIFALGLIALAFIDIEEQLLPNLLVYPLLVLGLLFNMLYADAAVASVTGATVAFASLWCVRTAYRWYSGIDGMGFGDLKLAATIGAWLGLHAVPAVLFLAFASGVVVTAPLVISARLSQKSAVPFGPFLAASGLAVLAFPVLSAFPMNLFAPT